MSYAQKLCSPTPVIEAVRNGNFEAGYLPGKHFVDSSAVGNSHDFISGKTFDFFSDLDFAGTWSDTTSICKYDLANQYAVTRWESVPCKYETNALSYGFNYIQKGAWIDHTTQTGAGYALLLDFSNAKDTLVGEWKTAWGQKINFLPNQEYHFSAWAANFNYSQQSTPTRLRIQILNQKEEIIQDTIIKETVINGGDLAWKQITQSYTTPTTAFQAIISIEVDPSGLENQDDYVLDDISFVNSQQSLAKNKISAHFKEKEISLCLNDAKVQLSPIVEKNPNLQYYWYKGDALKQELISNDDTLIAQKSGNYRVCIEDTISNSVYNAIITINTNLPLDLPNSLVLCNPKEYIVDSKYGKKMLSVWGGPNKSDSSSLLIDKVGDYTLYITTLNENQECMKEHTIKVSAAFPDVPTNLTYCPGFETELKGNQDIAWKWFEKAKGMNEIGVGKQVNYAFSDTLSGDQTLYIQQADNSYIGTLGVNNTANYPDGTKASTHFIAKQNIVIDSIDVSPTTWTGNCQQTGSTISYIFSIPSLNLEKSIILTCGKKQTIYLGFAVPIGNHELTINNGNVLSFSNVTKKEIDGVIEITSAQTSFANWKISTTNACAPLPVKIEEKCIITTIENNNDNNIIVSPNPFENNTTISTENISTIIIYNINGKIIESFENVNQVIIGNNFSTGIYFVSIQNENGIFHEKIIKQ